MEIDGKVTTDGHVMSPMTDDKIVTSPMTDDKIVTSLLATQVAGHQYDTNKRKMGMLSLGPGIVLKAVQDPPRGQREVDFYKKVFSQTCTDEDILALRNLLPKFDGILSYDSVKFLKLENITKFFKKPCVMDLKMGKVTYDPYADYEKMTNQRNKCPSAALLGFQIAGMMTYNSTTDSFERMDKSIGRNMTVDSMLPNGIGRFFGYPELLRHDAVRDVIRRLHLIRDWFLHQRLYCFYASSLLFVYEGQESSPVCDLCVTAPVTVEVKMIDFAHVFPTTDIDENYLSGLHNLIQHLERLLVLGQQ